MNQTNVLVSDIIKVKDDVTVVDNSIQNVNRKHVIAQSGQLQLSGSII